MRLASVYLGLVLAIFSSLALAQNCQIVNGRYTCNAVETPAAAASSASVVASATTSAVAPAEPSPEGQNCHQHGDHWHCDGEEESHDHSGHSHAGHDHSGHSHAGHSHGPSEEYGCGLAPLEDYNMGLHIAALFVLLAASIISVALPHLAKTFTKKSLTSHSMTGLTSWLFFGMRYFGGGIIISTAFIHLLFHAFVYYSNECVGHFQYEAAVAAVAMAAAYVVFLVDFFVLRPLRRRVLLSTRSVDSAASNARLEGKGSQIESQEDDRDGRSTPESEETLTLNKSESSLLKWNVVMLEAGIVFHSVIIGVTIGTASGAGWVPLLIAIVFHQFCEGLSLASRVSLLSQQSASGFFKALCHLIFVISTPLGVAIGIGVRRSFNGNDRDTLLAIGTLDAVSAGILLYSGFVQIIVGDFLNNHSLLQASVGRSIAAVILFTLGMFIMVSGRLVWAGS